MNQKIIEKLEEIADHYSASGDTWRARSYRTAIGVIIDHNEEITSGKDAIKLKGIGKSIADKIDHILENKPIDLTSKKGGPKEKITVHLEGDSPTSSKLKNRNPDIRELLVGSAKPKRNIAAVNVEMIEQHDSDDEEKDVTVKNTAKRPKLNQTKFDPNNYDDVMKLFNKVWGAGPVTCKSWYKKGFRTLADLKKHVDQLTNQQQIGLKYYSEFCERIPREEVNKIGLAVEKVLKTVDPQFHMEICGSYRRGLKDSGDIDILIRHSKLTTLKKLEGMLPKIISLLTDYKILTDHLSLGNDKYMGVCMINKKHRRIDIKMIPNREWYFALLYFTGSACLNKRMRMKAKDKNMKLNEKGLFDVNSGKRYHATSEQKIFEMLGMNYLEPTNRKY